MSLFMDSMRRFWVPGIPNVEAKPSLSLTSWLEAANYYVLDATTPGSFTIQFASMDEIAPLFAATANRVLSGCFESIVSIKEVERAPRSVAWLLVKLYYAAFFAAHGHMRACGVSCASVDALDAARIFDTARLYDALGGVERITPGQYLLTLDANMFTLSFSAVNASGSHEALWRTYKGFLETLNARLPSLIPVQQQRDLVARQLTQLRTILCLNGSNGGNWLSRFRNSVQYRHSHGAWHPYSLEKTMPSRMISNLILAFTENPDIASLSANSNRAGEEVDTFYRCTMFLSAIARATAIDMAARSTNGKSVSRRGAISFLRLCQLDGPPRPDRAPVSN